ncbi:MAG: hypothetical protein ACI8RD_005374 [Bacillariaceae sp.]|jgi:hypothetical protein
MNDLPNQMPNNEDDDNGDDEDENEHILIMEMYPKKKVVMETYLMVTILPTKTMTMFLPNLMNT